jgi:hypothetical protein
MEDATMGWVSYDQDNSKLGVTARELYKLLAERGLFEDYDSIISLRDGTDIIAGFLTGITENVNRAYSEALKHNRTPAEAWEAASRELP